MSQAGVGTTTIPIHLYTHTAVAQGSEVENVAHVLMQRDFVIKAFSARCDIATGSPTDVNLMLTKVVGDQLSGTETDCLSAAIELAGTAQANVALEMAGTLTSTAANLRGKAGDYLRLDVTVADGTSVTGVHGWVWVDLL